MDVNFLAGEVNRTWLYRDPIASRTHTIDLYHDTVTGLRWASIDFEEIKGSTGSSPLYLREPTRLQFSIGRARGVLIIEKSSMIAFRYICLVDGVPLESTLQKMAQDDEEAFAARIDKTAVGYSSNEKAVVWYELNVHRKSDGARTLVHRRYKEFAFLFEQVSSGFKGHALKSSLPELPGRHVKLLVDHTDSVFVEERRVQLHQAMQKLLAVPHVASMYHVQLFLGFFEALHEYSVVITQRDVGLKLGRLGGQTSETTAIVRDIDPAMAQGKGLGRVRRGDTVSKVNGEPASRFGLEGINLILQRGLRPMVLHFLQPAEGRRQLTEESREGEKGVEESKAKAERPATSAEVLLSPEAVRLDGQRAERLGNEKGYHQQRQELQRNAPEVQTVRLVDEQSPPHAHLESEEAVDSPFAGEDGETILL